jgi:primosomal protein N' (replication factor Y)
VDVARVLVESPIPRLDRLLDYAIPERLKADLVVGGRVKVPLGRGSRRVEGFVVSVGAASNPTMQLAEIDAVLGSVPVVTPALWSMVRAVSDRNGGSASDVLRVAVPKRAVRIEKNYLISPRHAPLDKPGTRSAVALDYGVVESERGPTLVGWARIAELARKAVGGVIIVVPDWRDVELMGRALGDLEHTVWDSSGTPTERYGRYLDVLSGASRVVVGTRSSIYAPVVDLSLIVVANESDPLLDEPLSPFVHVRDAAIVRQGIEGGDLVFASQTPSVELHRFHDLDYVERPAGVQSLPTIVISNDESDDEFARKARIPTSAWRTVRDALTRGPVLIQVSRPGFSPGVVCATCRTPHRCALCQAPLAGNREGTSLCRVCGNQPIGLVCSHCGGREVAFAGVGSLRTADELGRAFPQTTVILSDAEHRHLEIPRSSAIVVATRGAEPIVSGGYEAVLIVDGDKELMRPGLRTSENCLRWWGTAAALCAEGGTVVLANVGGGFAGLFASGQWNDIIATELRDRRALGFPPVTRAIAITGSVSELVAVRALPECAGFRIFGPAPSGKAHRIVILVDYGRATTVVAAIRAHMIARSTSSIRIHCDDLDVFDEVDVN